MVRSLLHYYIPLQHLLLMKLINEIVNMRGFVTVAATCQSCFFWQNFQKWEQWIKKIGESKHCILSHFVKLLLMDSLQEFIEISKTKETAAKKGYLS